MFDMEKGRSATVRARTCATLLKMSHASFRALLQRQPDLAFEVSRQLSLRLRDTDNAIIHGLQEKNRQLAAAYAELQAAQAQIIEKHRLERELQVAHEIQESILPHTLPVIPGIDMGVMMRPARAVDSAQDFCEAIFQAITQFQNGASQADDVAMVAIDVQ